LFRSLLAGRRRAAGAGLGRGDSLAATGPLHRRPDRRRRAALASLSKEPQMNRVRVLLSFVLMIGGAVTCHGQASGNVAYSQQGGRSRAEQNQRNKRVVAQPDAPPTATTMFVEASVLMNVTAD